MHGMGKTSVRRDCRAIASKNRCNPRALGLALLYRGKSHRTQASRTRQRGIQTNIIIIRTEMKSRKSASALNGLHRRSRHGEMGRDRIRIALVGHLNRRSGVTERI